MKGAIFVDGDNIFMHLKNLGKRVYLDKDIEWEDLFLALETRGIDLIIKKFYIVSHLIHPVAVNNIMHIGFSVTPTETYGDKALTDDYILIDAMETILTKSIEVLVIVSGDKDYLPLARKARERGINVIFVSFSENTAEVLKREFDFIDLMPFVKLEELLDSTGYVIATQAVDAGGDIL
ncbi:NYN domain-containing protein [Thermococcus barophilus]|uniref:NYN domain-containing protein n=1 Tax=Thermococcus barophilus TaxID=55802 RepID=A0A0S1XE97_THEBA|nr:NYN domain-containing protein [Thermococcus barophilus]ALM76056.1 hypothetical protein TBCH5v1_2155 [Thermococcus barophilus]